MKPWQIIAIATAVFALFIWLGLRPDECEQAGPHRECADAGEPYTVFDLYPMGDGQLMPIPRQVQDRRCWCAK